MGEEAIGLDKEDTMRPVIAVTIGGPRGVGASRETDGLRASDHDRLIEQ